MSATEYVILVDPDNTPIGTAEKLTAHQQNLLHRAFSIFIFREYAEGWQLLLQQRERTLITWLQDAIPTFERTITYC